VPRSTRSTIARTSRRRAAPVALAAALVLLAAACGDDDDETAAEFEPRTTEPPEDDGRDDADDTTPDTDDTDDTATDDTLPDATTVPTDPDAGSGEIVWDDCGSGFECGTLEVPLDYDDPDGEQIELALTRLPAADPDARIGSLLANPGGPGATGIDFIQGLAFALSPDIQDAFDIVGWDPRGVGESTPVDCEFDSERLFHPDPTPDDAAELQTIRTAQQEFAEQCGELAGDLLPHVGTQDTARDLDAIREALGDDGLTYVGFSYGTSIGQTYANLFPENVRAIVLDGVVDLSLESIELAEAQYRGFERQLDALLERCAADPGCTFATGSDPFAAFDALRTQVETAPIPSGDPDRPVGPGEFYTGTLLTLYFAEAYEALTEALAAAADGDGSLLLNYYDSYIGIGDQGPYAAINCIDSAWPAPDGFDALYAELQVEAPRLGAGGAYEYEWCSYWPVPPVDPLPSLAATGAPPILVVSTTGDPATPYEWGVHTAELLDDAVLVTHEGDGHTVYAGGVACVDDIVDAYLIDLELPPDGTVC
jgi:pimeloyl-ACP methyl ester carboxylesterase